MVTLVRQNYLKNKSIYNNILKELRTKIVENVPVDHVGSTAIPKMYGKNIIDILVGAKDKQEFLNLFDIISKLGFYPSQNSKSEIYQFFASKQGETASGDIHIHLVIMGTERYDEFLILRNYLLENIDEAKAYSNYKKQMLKDNIVERKNYRAVKSEYVTELIKRAKAHQGK